MIEISGKTPSMCIIATLWLLGLMSGCATMARSSTQTFVIETEPSGASIELSSGVSCESPCSLKLKRKKEFTATLSKEGYAPLTTEVSSGISGAGAAGLAGNLIGFNFVGLAVDATTGAAKNLYPNPLIVRLVPEDSGLESSVVSVLELNQSQMKKPLDGAFGITFGDPMTAELLMYKIDAGAFAKSYEVYPPRRNQIFDRYYIALDDANGEIRTIWANGTVQDKESCLVIKSDIEQLLQRRYELVLDANGLSGTGQTARVSCLEILTGDASVTDVVIQVWLSDDGVPEPQELASAETSDNFDGNALSNTAQ